MAFRKRTKKDVQAKRVLSDGSRKANGVKRKIGTEVKFKDGTTTILLNPSGKGKKFTEEIKTGVHLTNDLTTVKTDKSGKPLELDCCSKSYRSGYLAALADSAKAYKAKNNRPK